MKKKNIIIISLVVITLIVAAIIGILYAKTDMFKSDKNLFYKYLFKTKIISSEILQRYETMNDKIKSSNYSSSGNINCSTALNDTTTNIANIQELFSAKYNMLENRNLKQSYADFTISSNNQNIAILRYLKDDNTYAIKADNVVTKYLAIQNSNLKEFAKKLGIENVNVLPNSIPQMSIEEFLSIDETTVNNIKTKYGNIIAEKILSRNFKKTTNSDKTVTIVMSLSEQELKDIEKTILEALKNDDTILNLIINKAGILGYELNVDSLKTSIQEEIDKITDGTYSEESGFFKLAVTENGNDTLKLDLTMIVDSLENENSQEKVRTQVLYSIDLSENNKIIMNTNDGKGNNIKEVVTFGYDGNSIVTNVEVYQLDENKNEKAKVATIQYQINNYNTNDITQNMNISIISENNTKTQININNEIQLKQDINIEKITDSNAIILNNLSSEQLKNLMYQIFARLEYLYGNQLSTTTEILQ